MGGRGVQPARSGTLEAVKETVIYDGECNICRQMKEGVDGVDRSHRLEWIPYQEPTLLQRFPQLSLEACQKAMHVVLEDGSVRAGGDAVPVILERVGLKPLAAALRLPGMHALVDFAYNWVASHRHDLGCNSSSCSIDGSSHRDTGR